MVSCGGNPIIPPVEEEGNIHITDMFWVPDDKVIEITLNQFPSTWGDWTMYINGEKLSMEEGTGKPVVAPNADLDDSPTGLYVGTLPWLGPLTEVDFPCCGTIQFDIPGEGLTNEYEFNLINFGCETASEEECSQTPIPEPEPEIIIPDTTKITDEETESQLASVSPDQSEITFAQSTSQLEELQTGDILFIGVTDQTPYGLLRKVTNITRGSRADDTLTVSTEFTTLEEAVEELHFSLDIVLTQDDIDYKRLRLPPGVSMFQDRGGFEYEHTFNLSDVSPIYEGDSTTTIDDVTIDGEINLNYEMIFNVDIGLFNLDVEFRNIVESYTDLDVTIGGSLSLSNLLDPNPIHLFTIPFVPILVAPLVVTPIVYINLGLDGEVYAKSTIGVIIDQTGSNKLESGFEYDNGQWHEIKNDPVFDPEPKEPKLSLGGTIKPYVGPQLELIFNGCAGVYGSLYGYLELEADINDDPWWCLYGGFEGIIGAQLKILSFDLGDPVEWTIFNPPPKKIAQADGPFGDINHAPEITSDPVTSATKDQPYSYDVHATDPDVGDTMTYSLTTKPTGMTINSSTGLISWTPTSIGDYDVIVEVSDNGSPVLSDTQSFTINVDNDESSNLPAPANVVASQGTMDMVQITWSSVTGATHYRVYRATSETGTKTAIEGWGWITNNYAVDFLGITQGVHYFYFVKAATDSNGSNASSYSEWAEGWTTGSPDVIPTIYDPGSSVDSGTPYTVSWSDESADGAEKYNLFEIESTATSGTLYTVYGTSKEFTHNVDTDTTYNYKVRAYADGAWSSYSGQVDMVVKYDPNLSYPDLTISLLTYYPENPTTSDTIEFWTRVKNIGGETAGESVLQNQIGSEIEYINIPELLPNQVLTIVREKQLSAQNYRITAIADVYNNVIESNEDNNEEILDLTVSDETNDIIYDTPCDVWTAWQSGSGVGITTDIWDISVVATGSEIDFTFDAMGIPDRWFIYYNGVLVHQTGWRGNASYDGDPLYPGGVTAPPDGQVLAVITKLAGVDILEIRTEGKDPNTAWDYRLRSNCIEYGTYDLRDIGPAGGYIFYDKGSYSDGWRYLESAPVSTEWTDEAWGSYGNFIGGTGSDIGTGENNTSIIMSWLNSHGETGKAAQLCYALVYGGYSDWFLPSLDELYYMYENLKCFGVGSFTDRAYWSSTEYDANNAQRNLFEIGYQRYSDKRSTFSVRAARAF